MQIYHAIVAALPGDLDARMKIADLCVAARWPELARRVYAAVAYYDLQGGRPLHALQTLGGPDRETGGEALCALLERHHETEAARYVEEWLQASA